MPSFFRLPYAIREMRSAWRWARSNDDEGAAAFYWNREMFRLRVELETIERYLGGRAFAGFESVFFQNALDGSDGYVCPSAALQNEEIEKIAKAWREDDLYGKILAGDAAIFSMMNANAVKWLEVLIGTQLSGSSLNIINWSELNDRFCRWSGYAQDGVPWTLD